MTPPRPAGAGRLLVAAGGLVLLVACGSDPDVAVLEAAVPQPSVTATAVGAATSLPSATVPVTTTATTSTATTTTTSTSTTTTSTSTTTTSTSTTTASTSTTTASTSTVPPPPGTRCRSVAVIGDSTSVGMDGSTGLVTGGRVLAARLADIGVEDLWFDADGGRSLVERVGPQENAVEVAQRFLDTGFDGCWLIAVGTNDAANIDAGSAVGVRTRVERLLDVVGDDSVLWFDAATTASTGHWAVANMRNWNVELRAVVEQRPNVFVVPWSSIARPEWFLADGIHHDATGLDARVGAYADSLVLFLPG